MQHNTIKVFAMRCSYDNIFKGRIEEMENVPQAFKRFVYGHMQIANLTKDIDIVFNAGDKNTLPANRVWRNENGKVIDAFGGNILACRHDAEGNFTSILEDDIPVILKALLAFSCFRNRKLYLKREENLPEYAERKKF